MAYIVIDNCAADGSRISPLVLRIDSNEERDAARAALRERGLEFERVSVGEPDDPDSYQTSERLYA